MKLWENPIGARLCCRDLRQIEECCRKLGYDPKDCGPWKLVELGGIATKPQDQGEFLTGKGQKRFSEEQKKDGEIVSSAWKATKDTGRSQWP